MFQEKRSIAFCNGALSMTISMNSPPRGACSDHAQNVIFVIGQGLECVDDRRACHDTSRMSNSRCTCGGTIRKWRAGAAATPVFMATARAPMLDENLARQAFRHHAARRGVEHERRGMRGMQLVVQPVETEIGDRRHIDQHFRQHHEQDREQQQLAGQSESACGAPGPEPGRPEANCRSWFVPAFSNIIRSGATAQ